MTRGNRKENCRKEIEEKRINKVYETHRKRYSRVRIDGRESQIGKTHWVDTDRKDSQTDKGKINTEGQNREEKRTEERQRVEKHIEKEEDRLTKHSHKKIHINEINRET